MGDTIAIPIGDAALDFNGMICLNEVGEEIFQGLLEQKTRDEILDGILGKFDVSREEAVADIDDFLSGLRQSDLLEY